MSEGDLELVRRALKAFSEGDLETLEAISAPDGVIDLSRSIGPDRGLFEGSEGLRRYVATFLEPYESFEIKAVELFEEGGAVVAVTKARGVGRASGAEVEAKAASTWEIRDGKVFRTTMFQNREEALESLRE